jgi:hypothetical protein
MLARLKTYLAWLRDQVLSAMRRGDDRGMIHQANLIPPGLAGMDHLGGLGQQRELTRVLTLAHMLNDEHDVYQPYLIMREHVIDRLYHQTIAAMAQQAKR